MGDLKTENVLDISTLRLFLNLKELLSIGTLELSLFLDLLRHKKMSRDFQTQNIFRLRRQWVAHQIAGRKVLGLNPIRVMRIFFSPGQLLPRAGSAMGPMGPRCGLSPEVSTALRSAQMMGQQQQQQQQKKTNLDPSHSQDRILFKISWLKVFLFCFVLGISKFRLFFSLKELGTCLGLEINQTIFHHFRTLLFLTSKNLNISGPQKKNRLSFRISEVGTF